MEQNFSLRQYQVENAVLLHSILVKNNVAAFVGEMRIGKTLTSLHVAEMLGCKKVLFITKKKAISSILSDYKLLGANYELICINYESMHKVDTSDIDLLVADESHCFSSFPKPSLWAKNLKAIMNKNINAKLLLLSGTFSPESYSQVYHQFWISPYSPFANHKSFYKWANTYVFPKKKRIGAFFVNDYSHANEQMIDNALDGYILSFTQKQAGFVSNVAETIHYVQPHIPTLTLIKTLIKDKIVEGTNDVIIADTAVKMQQKCHQMYSGTIKLDSGNRLVLNEDKAKYIFNHFKGKRMAIIYKFVAESYALKSIFGTSITDDLTEFQNSDHLHFLGQVSSTKEGTDLSKADVLVMYNIDFSATAYFQARSRLSTKERPDTQVHWVFTKGGLEDDIYKTVSKKKDYTLSYFKKYLTTSKKELSLKI